MQLFGQSGINTVFTNLEGFPEDWKENPDSFVKFVREHHFPGFLEYGEYPYVTADEVKKALRLKAAFSDMLDQMPVTAHRNPAANECVSFRETSSRNRPQLRLAEVRLKNSRKFVSRTRVSGDRAALADVPGRRVSVVRFCVGVR